VATYHHGVEQLFVDGHRHPERTLVQIERWDRISRGLQDRAPAEHDATRKRRE